MNAIDLLTKDHRTVEKLFNSFSATDDGSKREGILVEIIQELSIHAAIEEAHLYPLMRDELPDGQALYTEGVKEHQKVKEILGRLDGRVDKAHTKEVAEMVERLQKNVMHHVEEEEGEVFPELQKACSATMLNELGSTLAQAKKDAPTRPHPNQPPATELTGKANAALDKARDKVSGRS